MIKEILIVLFLMFNMLPVLAKPEYNCVNEPYPVSGKMSSIINTITGSNWVSRRAIEGIIESNLKKNTHSKFDVKLSIFNATDLVAGKFKNLKFQTDAINMGGIYVHDLQGSTYCGYNRIIFKKNETPQVYEDFYLDFSAKITNDDLQKTVFSSEFKKYMDNLQLNLGGHQLLKVETPRISIVNNKIHYDLKVVVSLLFASFSRDLNCEMGLKVQNGKLAFSDVNVNNLGIISFNDINQILKILNPLKINLEKTLGLPSQISINDVDIKNNEIGFSGTLIIPKNTRAKG